jgi:hypothetical protein
MSSTKAATVEDASPSPPRSPAKAPESTSAAQTGDAKTLSQGDKTLEPPAETVQGEAGLTQDEEDRKNEGEEDEDEEWDPSAETSLKGKREAVVEKNKSDNSAATTPGAQDTGGWQAIWAPSNNGQSLLPVL